MLVKAGLQRQGKLRSLAAVGLAALALGSLTGCQGDYSGQTLPSPHYLEDDVQYFAPGPEMLYSNEVSALERYDRDRQVTP